MPNVRSALARLAPVLLAAALFGAASGCSAPVRVAFDEGEDFSRYRTWEWRPNVSATLASPTGRSSQLNLLLSSKIARELGSRGYEPARDTPDLLVGYGLTLEHRIVVAEVPRAPYLLSSLSSSASYWVEGSDLEKQKVADVTLGIEITDGQGRHVWSGESKQRLQRGQKFDMDASVAALLERLPARASGPEGP
jgi:hypothetical protein